MSFIASALRVHRKLLQILQINLLQRLLIRRLQEHLRDDLVARRLAPSRLKSLQPPARAETPLAPALHARDRTEVIALSGAEVEELVGDFGGDGVVAGVAGWNLAVAGPEVAGHWACAVHCEGLLEDWGVISWALRCWRSSELESIRLSDFDIVIGFC